MTISVLSGLVASEKRAATAFFSFGLAPPPKIPAGLSSGLAPSPNIPLAFGLSFGFKSEKRTPPGDLSPGLDPPPISPVAAIYD